MKIWLLLLSHPQSKWWNWNMVIIINTLILKGQEWEVHSSRQWLLAILKFH